MQNAGRYWQNSLIMDRNKKLEFLKPMGSPKEDQFGKSSDRREIDIKQHFNFKVLWIKKKRERFLYTSYQEMWGENCVLGKGSFNQYGSL